MASNPETKRGSPFVFWGLGVAALVIAVVAVRYFTRERVSVYTAKASYQTLVRTASTNGKVEPVEDFQPHAQSAGIVENIYVTLGQKVKPGQLLLQMDDADAKARLASAESALQAARLALSDLDQGGTQDERNAIAGDLSRAKLQVQQDTTALATLERLQKQGAAAPAEVLAARDRLSLAQSNLDSIEQHGSHRYGAADRARAQAQLADAQASVAAAQSAVANANIRTPIAGTVNYLPVAQYDYVNAGDELIYVADLNHIQVTAYFDEPDVGNLADGQPVKITWDAKPGTEWHGHITTAPTTIISYGQRNVGECYIAVDDARGDLLPNTNVLVTVTTAQHFHALSVPHEALHTDPGRTWVFRVINNKLVRTPVQVGIVNPTRAEIVSGLAEGEVVALNPVSINRELTNGLEVTPVQ